MTAKPAYLGITASLTGRRWIGPGAEEDRLAEAMEQLTTLPGPVCRTLVRQGVPPEQAERYLSPSLRDLLPDPLSLRDMQKSAERFLTALLVIQAP